MEWYPVPSLERMASIKVIIQIFRSPDISNKFVSLHRNFNLTQQKKMNGIEGREFTRSMLTRRPIHKLPKHVSVEPLLRRLGLPMDLEKRLVQLCEPLAQQLVCWAMAFQKSTEDCHCFLTDSEVAGLLQHVRWTSEGRIDYKGTFEALMQLVEQEDDEELRLACTYWSERGTGLAYEMSILHRLSIFHYEREKECCYEDPKFCLRALKGSAYYCNELAFKHYCLEIESLDTNDARHILNTMVINQEDGLSTVCMDICRGMSRLHHPSDPEIIRLLMSRLSEQQWTEVLRNVPIERVAMRFLEWPYQDIFMNFVGLTWDFLEEDSFAKLLLTLFEKIPVDGVQSVDLVDYKQVFRELWTQSPPRYRTGFLVSERLWLLVNSPFKAELMHKEGLLTLVLRQFSCEEKKTFFDRLLLLMADNSYIWNIFGCPPDYLLYHFLGDEVNDEIPLKKRVFLKWLETNCPSGNAEVMESLLCSGYLIMEQREYVRMLMLERFA